MMELIRKLKFKGKSRLIRLFFPKQFSGSVSYFRSKIFVDTTEHIGWEIYWNGKYEPDVIWLLDNYVHKNSLCVDVGANIGTYTIPMAEKAKRVIAFEPHPGFRERLVDNLNINKFGNVEVRPLAVMDVAGKAVLHSPPKDMSNKSATLYKINSELTEPINVCVSTLDKEIREDVDFIKIDTDGADADVILGAKETISRSKPIILFEYIGHFPQIKERFQMAFDFLKGNGYSLHKVIKKSKTENFSIEKAEDFCNILALPYGHSI